MPNRFSEIAFTDTVKKVQEAQGSRKNYARFETHGPVTNNALGERERDFIAARDSFYMASVSETGWPYVQHRGGPAGFVKVLDEKRIGFADFRGNRQYVSVGNFMTDNRIALFFMDYLNKTRLKMLGRVDLVDAADAGMLSRLAVPDYRARVERGMIIRVEGFDWNCPAHITPRLTLDEVADVIAPLQDRIRQLEAAQC
jgi:predicted pyridoxine 5'-phosphate oxidase superfamily flavin-nucleotide-binding protein